MRYRLMQRACAASVYCLASGVLGAAGIGESEEIACDVCVIGGGSGGYGAALAAARAGADVVLLERQTRLGGSSTSAFVTNWEPGPGGPFARELYERLRATPGAVAIAPRVHGYRREEPYGMACAEGHEELSYDDTLARAGRPFAKRCCVVMKPEALAAAMLANLAEAKVRVSLETTFDAVEAEDRSVHAVHAQRARGPRLVVHAPVFVDATGGVALCRKLGCETMLGTEPRARFHEPAAPDDGSDFLNAISLCYRIRRVANPVRQSPPEEDVGTFARTAFVSGVDYSELIVNPLPLVPGTTLVKQGYDATVATAHRRVLAHWRWLQSYPQFQGYELKDIAPMLGIRESYRVVAEYILTEADVRTPLARSPHPDIIAAADHALDIHGGGPGIKELQAAYGIPYRCLIPKGWRNVLVACRGAGFSHVAASSCRLSRTMMALGRAAGLAAAQACRADGEVRRIDVNRLVREVGIKAGQAAQ